MCGACKGGYSYSAALQGCVACSDSSAWVQSFLIMALGIAAAGVLYVVRTGEVALPTGDWFKVVKAKVHASDASDAAHDQARSSSAKHSRAHAFARRSRSYRNPGCLGDCL